MSYTVFFFLIASGYIFGEPIVHDSLQFRLIECIPGDNNTLSKHIIEITNINETCIRVNASTAEGHEVYLYIVPETEIGVKVHIKTENCSTPLPELHFSLCDEPTSSNHTGSMITFEYTNATLSEISLELTNSTNPAIIYTGATVYETLHSLDGNDTDSDSDSDDDDDDDDKKSAVTTYKTTMNIGNSTEATNSTSD